MRKTNHQKVWNKNEIVAMLIGNDKAVERGIVAIFRNQTLDEQKGFRTRYKNNVGFNKVHDKFGTYLAKYILAGNNLDKKYIEKARKITIYYARQLTDIANKNNIIQ